MYPTHQLQVLPAPRTIHDHLLARGRKSLRRVPFRILGFRFLMVTGGRRSARRRPRSSRSPPRPTPRPQQRRNCVRHPSLISFGNSDLSRSDPQSNPRVGSASASSRLAKSSSCHRVMMRMIAAPPLPQRISPNTGSVGRWCRQQTSKFIGASAIVALAFFAENAQRGRHRGDRASPRGAGTCASAFA